MPDGFLIGPNLLRDIRELTDAGGNSKDGASPVQGKQITYVKATSSTPTSGWYPGVVRTYSSGGSTDHAGAIEIAGPNGEALVSGRVYMAIRQGPSASGVPRYIAQRGGGSVITATANADNAGGGVWTAGTAQESGEAIELAPKYGQISLVPIGGVTFANHKLWNGLEYMCRDSGTTNTSNGKRRYYAWPIGLVVCDATNPNAPVLRMI